jgi:hypothetical protein
VRVAPLVAALAACAAPLPALAQTMLDQEQRLIELHALLLDLPPLQSPAALAAWDTGISLEIVGIPPIDGTTGSKTQLTASDHTRLFPRPRLQVGLLAPEGCRAFAGLSWIPPVEIQEVSTNALAAEAGFGTAQGAFRGGVRIHGVLARARAPVTDPATRDVLDAAIFGADLAAGAHLAWQTLALDPYAGAGIVALHGRFTVTTDGNVLASSYAGPALHAGARLLWRSRWEGVAEVDGYPQRLVHVNFRLGYVFGG